MDFGHPLPFFLENVQTKGQRVLQNVWNFFKFVWIVSKFRLRYFCTYSILFLHEFYIISTWLHISNVGFYRNVVCAIYAPIPYYVHIISTLFLHCSILIILDVIEIASALLLHLFYVRSTLFLHHVYITSYQ